MAAQRFTIPKSMIQIKDSCCLLFEIRIPRPNPASVTPGTNSIFAQPAPDGFSADRGHNTLFFSLIGNFTMSKSGKRKSEIFRQLAGKCFNRNNDFRGKKRRVSRAVAFPEGRPDVGQRNVYAIWRQSVEADRVVDRFACLKAHRRQGGQSWLA
jgi:hypothetical protein